MPSRLAHRRTNGTALRAVAAALGLAVALPAAAAASDGKVVRYLWNLSTETGPLQATSYGLALDPTSQEILVTGENVVRVYNASGMEDFAFELPDGAGRLLAAAAIGDAGDLFLLTIDADRWALRRASFRGELLGEVELRGVPAGLLEGFVPQQIRVRNGHAYLASIGARRVLVVDADGNFVRHVDLAEVLDMHVDAREPEDLSGFGVDVDGGLLLTIATRFRAYAISPSGEVKSWGVAGGAPGRFNVTSGIAADERHYYVADALKSAVVVFDRNLKFVEEFGFRRPQEQGGLISPSQVEAGGGRIYVSQRRDRGVSVYAVAAAPPGTAVADGSRRNTGTEQLSIQ